MDFITPKSGRLWKNKADFFRPFRNAAAEAGENIIPLYDPTLCGLETEQAPDLKELNASLAALADVFPDVQPEVFREMLSHLGEESRLQVVTEHLLQQKAKWVQGRYRTPAKHPRSRARPTKTASSELLEAEDFFRANEYKQCVKQVLYQEFKSLSHSTIKGVLAEQNFSYTLSRHILHQVQARSWRMTIANLWSKRPAVSSAASHPYVIWKADEIVGGLGTPAVRCTGSAELDVELYNLHLAPIITKQRQDRIFEDRAKAVEVNEAEAEQAEALFDCECCYSSVAFEEIAVCDDQAHVLCLGCIQKTVKEALFGQGWSSTTDLGKATVRCFSPTAEGCEGSIPADLVRRALGEMELGPGGLWEGFQTRVSNETLIKTGCSLQRCGSCTYAEIDDIPDMTLKHPLAFWHHVARRSPIEFQILVIAILMTLPLVILPLLATVLILWLAIQVTPPASGAVRKSLVRVHKRRRGLKFKCQNPQCLQTTCTRCMALWHDPHTCFESESTSLRTAIEASATAAVKRTCPRCMLSFVKSSGCNKLVCNCGYTMCYICRQEVSSKEGYNHFCQHFRPNGGRCTTCERCDLYGDEDEDAAIRKAAQQAERAWQEMEGSKEGDERATKLMIDTLVDQARGERWSERWLDVVVDAIIA